MPRVSVIVPNYNHGRFLKERLDSILAQTYRDFELIYLDDASTDESSDIWDGYTTEPRLKAVVQNPVNSGSPFAQWNRGVQLASGEYIWIAESDDRACPRFLERLVAVLDAGPALGVAYCQSHLIDTWGKRFGSAYDYNRNLGAQQQRWAADFIACGRQEIAHFLARQCTLPNASAVVFRRSVFQEIGGAETWLKLAGDYLLWIRMLLVSDLAFVAEPLNEFRRHTNTVRSRAYRDGTSLLESYKIQAILRESLPIPREVAEAACDDLMDRWTELTLLQPGRASLKQLRAIWRWQRQVDPAPLPRFTRRLRERALAKAEKLKTPKPGQQGNHR